MYNLNIPGWMSENDLQGIELLAQKIPVDGVMVEIGSFGGRSSWAWSKSVKSGVTVHCIDLWDTSWNVTERGKKWLSGNLEGFVPFSIESFIHNVSDCDNIVPMQAKSPNIKWEELVDLVFIDDDHTEQGFLDNLNFWYPRVKDGGVLCGHDYMSFPIVKTVVDKFAKDHGHKIITCSENIWMFEK